MNSTSLQEILSKQSNPSLGLYIHIPFCRVRCQFCAFYVQIQQEEKILAFLTGLEREITLYGKKVGLENVPVTSVYFGGGTPTVLSSRQLLHILDGIHSNFSVQSDAEISLEAHPGAMNREDLDSLRSGGFNRLSIGAQSFDDRELLQLGGRSMSLTTHAAVEAARQSGFENISLDLMYGFPGHTTPSWKRTLDVTITLAPTHLSCYAFTVDEGSQVYEKVEGGTLCAPDEEMQTRLAEFTREYLTVAGYQQYEISNFCRQGFPCHHNLRYWQGDSYLGLGPSAQSFVSGVRFGNLADLDLYGSTLAGGAVPVEQVEVLDPQEIQRELIVFGLRTIQGVPMEHIQNLSRGDVQWDRALNTLKSQGLLAEAEGCMHLTNKGIQFADNVAVTLL
ncbi:radical SAM family heme chaperone HemW [Candidatus Nitronereus thalassa]|uniref:Heme chaperone HemW n=1 Tax=Candidatus Nitronereus thalassa TaxID=3020898 RepID=A0ABU3K3T7_9BACT|nr:radical SAM family heme chaperone HemW [Candidatus Nitronereus thalassa]MDT7041047.1 radical SAM family heme chaperone HemW [Candidatus Nitronereus thalassa]